MSGEAKENSISKEKGGKDRETSGRGGRDEKEGTGGKTDSCEQKGGCSGKAWGRRPEAKALVESRDGVEARVGLEGRGRVQAVAVLEGRDRVGRNLEEPHLPMSCCFLIVKSSVSTEDKRERVSRGLIKLWSSLRPLWASAVHCRASLIVITCQEWICSLGNRSRPQPCCSDIKRSLSM